MRKVCRLLYTYEEYSYLCNFICHQAILFFISLLYNLKII